MLGSMGDGTASQRRIRLHAPAGPRPVTVGGDDAAEVRSHATERLAELLDHPPGLLLTGSCTAALEASAAALDLQPGDEVVVPAFTYPTTVSPFVARGATVRFADVDPATGDVDPVEVLARVTPRTRAVVVMHYAGVAADVATLTPTLTDRGIDLIEDAAQGLFASLDGVPLGRLGRFGTLSFHHTKNASTVEGGALVVNRPEDVEVAQVLVDKGTNRRSFDAGEVPAYEWCAVGSSWAMPEAATRLLVDELDRAPRDQARRHAVWDRYQRDLAPWAREHGVALPVVPTGRAHPAHLSFIVLPSADARPGFIASLAAAGVDAAWHYGSLPASTFGRTIAHPEDACPRAADLAERLVRLPLHQALSDEDVDRVVAAVSATRPA